MLSTNGSDVDAHHDEFVQSLIELMGWYGKSVKDVLLILEAESSIGSILSFPSNVKQSIH